MFRQVAGRTVLVGGLGLATVLPIPVPAAAEWSDTECDPTERSCEVEVGIDPEPAADSWDPVGGGWSGDHPSVSDPGTPDEQVCESWIEETDADSDYRAGTRPSDEHQLMHTSCKYPDGTGSIDSEWVLVDEDGNPVIDPAVLAQQAVDNLVLPTPQIAVSPADFQLVQLPVWLWLEGSSWQDQSASASVPGLTVTATAEPVRARWAMGDGSRVTCEGAGTKWTPAYGADEESPTCGHTYTRSSAGAPGGEFAVTVTVTVEWAVSWSGGGASGTEPGMTTTAATSWLVAQSQSLVK